jgi:hypothetical protein
MPWRKGLSLDMSTLRKVWVDMVQAAMVAVSPSADKIPQADGDGKIAAGWVPLLGIASIPVAADGVVSSTSVVRADDSRLGNPAVGGDLSGTAAAATVIKLRGRAVASGSPSAGQVLAWNATTSQWEPTTPSIGGGLSLQESGGSPITPVTSVTVSPGTLTDLGGGAVAIDTSGSGGGYSPGATLYLFDHYR